MNEMELRIRERRVKRGGDGEYESPLPELVDDFSRANQA
jgi:hypothetical protein